jgi:hypothetical protein
VLSHHRICKNLIYTLVAQILHFVFSSRFCCSFQIAKVSFLEENREKEENDETKKFESYFFCFFSMCDSCWMEDRVPRRARPNEEAIASIRQASMELGFFLSRDDVLGGKRDR